MDVLPNRFITPVTIEIQTNSGYNYKTFSDLQMAYIWVRDITRPLLTFEAACISLDEAYRIRGLRGHVFLAENPSSTYIAYYGTLTI